MCPKLFTVCCSAALSFTQFRTLVGCFVVALHQVKPTFPHVRKMQKHSPENLAFERFVPSPLQVVPRFRGGYFRDCSARSQSRCILEKQMYHLESYPGHRQRHRYEHAQPQSDSSVWVHLKFSHYSCTALRATRLHQETWLGSCRMLGEKEVLMTCLFGVGAWYAHQERALPRNNVLRCFPPTADLARHTCFGHHPTKMSMRGGAQRSMIMSATGPWRISRKRT